MLRKLILGIIVILIFVLLASGTYVLLSSGNSVMNNSTNTSINTKSFSLETVSSVNGKGITTATISNIPGIYDVKYITRNMVSLEVEGVQLLVENPGIEAFNIYSLQSNDFIEVQENRNLPKSILRYTNNGEIIEKSEAFKNLKYNLKFFYVDGATKNDSDCIGNNSCAEASINAQNFNFYIYCSVQSSDLVSRCDQVLASLKVNVVKEQ